VGLVRFHLVRDRMAGEGWRDLELQNSEAELAYIAEEAQNK